MPYASKAQAAYFNANRAKLEAEGVNVDEWNNSSKGKKLPKKATKEAAVPDQIMANKVVADMSAVGRKPDGTPLQPATAVQKPTGLPKKASEVLHGLAPITSGVEEVQSLFPPDLLRDRTYTEQLVDYVKAKKQKAKIQEESKSSVLDRILPAMAISGGVGALSGFAKGSLAGARVGGPAAWGLAGTLGAVGAGSAAAFMLGRRALRGTLDRRADKTISETDPSVIYAARHPDTEAEVEQYAQADHMPHYGAEVGVLGGAVGTLAALIASGNYKAGDKFPGWTTAGGAVAGAGIGLALGSWLKNKRKQEMSRKIEDRLATARNALAQEAVTNVEAEQAEQQKLAAEKNLRRRSEVIITNGDGILGIKKADYLLLPGGGIEEDERPPTAAERETDEEAGRKLDELTRYNTVECLYDGEGPSPGYDGEKTYFFTAQDGGESGTEHKDREDFVWIPFTEAIAHLRECMKDPKNAWAESNNVQRLTAIREVQRMKKTAGPMRRFDNSHLLRGITVERYAGGRMMKRSVADLIYDQVAKDLLMRKTAQAIEQDYLAKLAGDIEATLLHKAAEDVSAALAKQPAMQPIKPPAPVEPVATATNDLKVQAETEQEGKSAQNIKTADAVTLVPRTDVLLFTPSGKLAVKRLPNRRFELPTGITGSTAVPYEMPTQYVPLSGIEDPGAHGYEIKLHSAEGELPEGYEEAEPDAVLKDMYASMGLPQNRDQQMVDRARSRALLRILKKRAPRVADQG